MRLTKQDKSLSPVAELKDIVRVGHDPHAGDAGRLDIPARQVETIPHYGPCQTMSGHRHHRQFRPTVRSRIVCFQRPKGRHKMPILMFPARHVDSSVVDRPRSPAPFGRHAGFDQAPPVGRGIVFFDYVGIARSKDEGASQPAPMT